jgi:hypothetical protein
MRPTRAACLGTATALVTLLACAPVAAAAATDTDSAHAKSGDRVITLIGRLAQQTRFPVNPAAPPPGRSDRLPLDPLRPVRQPGRRHRRYLHHHPGRQQRSGGVRRDLQPPGRPALRAGNGLRHSQPGPPPSFDNGITGGTGEFDRARGSVHADTIAPGTRRFTIDLDR